MNSNTQFSFGTPFTSGSFPASCTIYAPSTFIPNETMQARIASMAAAGDIPTASAKQKQFKLLEDKLAMDRLANVMADINQKLTIIPTIMAVSIKVDSPDWTCLTPEQRGNVCHYMTKKGYYTSCSNSCVFIYWNRPSETLLKHEH